MFEIDLELNNAAFADHPGAEIAQILRALADRLDNLTPDGEGQLQREEPLRDANGNRCGNWRIAFYGDGE